MATRRRRLTGVSDPADVERLLAQTHAREVAAQTAALDAETAQAMAEAQAVQDMIIFLRDNAADLTTALRSMAEYSDKQAEYCATTRYLSTADLFTRASVHWHGLGSRLALLTASLPATAPRS